MSWLNLLMKGKKVAGKALKKTGKRVKEDAPFLGLVGAVEAGKHGYNIAKGKKDIHEGTITGIIKHIKKVKKHGNKD